MDSNGDGNATGAGDGPPIEIPAPRPRFGGPFWPHFHEKHEKKPELLNTNRYISGSRGRIDKGETGLISVPPPDLSPLKKVGIRGYAAYPVILYV